MIYHCYFEEQNTNCRCPTYSWTIAEIYRWNCASNMSSSTQSKNCLRWSQKGPWPNMSKLHDIAYFYGTMDRGGGAHDAGLLRECGVICTDTSLLRSLWAHLFQTSGRRAGSLLSHDHIDAARFLKRVKFQPENGCHCSRSDRPTHYK